MNILNVVRHLMKQNDKEMKNVMSSWKIAMVHNHHVILEVPQVIEKESFGPATGCLHKSLFHAGLSSTCLSTRVIAL